MPLADGSPTTAGPSPRHPPLPPPPSGLLPRGGGLGWGQPRALGPRGDPRATSAPPPNASQPLPWPSKPVLSPSKPALSRLKGPRDPARWRAGPRPDLRVNVAKCRRMSHYFAPPLVNPCNLRVKNLTFWAHFRPFWPISVHFRLTRRHSRAPIRESTPPRAGSSSPTALSFPATPPARPFAAEHEHLDREQQRAAPRQVMERAALLPERRRGFYAEPRSRAELPAAVGDARMPGS